MVPHPIPYQGSKRWIAGEVVGCLPTGTERLIEPFAGSAAVTLAAAYHGVAGEYVLNDINGPLMALWKEMVNHPERLAGRYAALWKEQHGQEREYYDLIRKKFNRDHQPEHFLYLLARCVKAAIRYNARGEFNNSPDHRRKGAHPETMRAHLFGTSELLRGRTEFAAKDYRDVLEGATSVDAVYMDPPYQGVCLNRDQRYLKGVQFDEFVAALDSLNRRGVPFVVSYDGRTGDKEHGRRLPESLELLRLEVDAGRSTQATLLGRTHKTYESLYLSPVLMARIGVVPSSLRDDHCEPVSLFDGMP